MKYKVRVKGLGCWFCGSRLEPSSFGTKIAQACKKCNRLNISRLEPVGEWQDCDKCGAEDAIWVETGKEWYTESDDANFYLDQRIDNVKSINRDELYVLRNDAQFIDCCQYECTREQPFMLEREVGRYLNQRLVVEFDRKRYLKNVIKEWHKRDEDKKYRVTKKDVSKYIKELM